EREEETCCMVWWPFATTLERVDTSEATDLHTYAPPLYSTDRAIATLGNGCDRTYNKAGKQS
ncbi:MAG: hypothetical protein LC770_06050, partial [Acidobacteria bacterium]|nr:hypothetical protein [Acidobacteriota bacterium]